MNIHFIAIGGSAMHNLAIALHDQGETVTGSDDEVFEPSRSRLAEKGLLPENEGWFPERITTELDAVILGMHAKKDNPELKKAQELGLKIYSYPEFIYEKSKYKTRVVIAGSHGKTTITAMVLHVLNYHHKPTDFMVGAQLEGFSTMIKLTQENDFILLEGDEYLSSPIDPQPKFLWYQPNIALISGIAWDHINVFGTYEEYQAQFEYFVDNMTNGSTLVYNEEDEAVKKIAENAKKPTRKHAYRTPRYEIIDEGVHLDTPEGLMPLQIFGEHNMSNLAGAKWICQHMGVDEDDFYEAIAEFKGADKRLQKVIKTDKAMVLKDYAHSPSKVQATTNAVKKQFSKHKLLACLELHTYSSLTKEFLVNYKHSLDQADEAVVVYDPKALEIKRLDPIDENAIKEAFGRQDLKIFTEPKSFHHFLKSYHFDHHLLLMMSSGNYAGLDFDELKKWVE